MTQINKESFKDLKDLHPLEIDLIITLREEFKYGSVEIQMHDGLPRNLLKTVQRRNLGNFDVFHNREDLQKKYLSDIPKK
jgi:hypothetical protein